MALFFRLFYSYNALIIAQEVCFSLTRAVEIWQHSSEKTENTDANKGLAKNE